MPQQFVILVSPAGNTEHKNIHYHSPEDKPCILVRWSQNTKPPAANFAKQLIAAITPQDGEPCNSVIFVKAITQTGK